MSCNHYKLLLDQPEPDFDVLLSRLSQYAFTRLSARDQQLQVEKIRQYVNEVEVQGSEESDEALSLRSSFSELLKKLSYSDQLGRFLSNAIKKLKWERIISSYKQLEVDHQKQIIWKTRVHRPSLKKVPYFHQLYLFLYKVIPRFKRERPLGKEELISSFEQLEVDHQQQLIEEATVYIASMNGETEEDFRLRQFTELYRDATGYVNDLLFNSSNREENEEEATFDDSLDTFGEFFLGFAKIWFEGQSKRSRDLLIEQFADGLTISNSRPEESEEDFKLRTFTGLCKKVAAGRKVADLRVQFKFLDYAEQKLESWGRSYSYTERLIGEPQEFESAAELLCRLSAIGFSLLSAEYQQQTIERMINQIERGLAAIDDDEEVIMSNQVESRLAVVEESMDEEQDMRVKTFTELFNQFSVPTRIELFKEFKRKLSGLFDLQKRNNADEVRLIRILEADEKWGRQGTSVKDDEEQESSPYAKFLFHVSLTWFKERSANYWRNPISVILFGRMVEISDDIEKLPEENEEDFRLRRFTESFQRLQITSREKIIQYIAEGLSRDLGYSQGYEMLEPTSRQHVPLQQGGAIRGGLGCIAQIRFELAGGGAIAQTPFASEWRDMIEFPPPTPQGAAGSATTQAGGGTSQGTTGLTKTTWLRSLIRRVF